MTATVDQRRRALHAPVAAPFAPEQEIRLRELGAEELTACSAASRRQGSLRPLLTASPSETSGAPACPAPRTLGAD